MSWANPTLPSMSTLWALPFTLIVQAMLEPPM
jgi:hypothetical protein